MEKRTLLEQTNHEQDPLQKLPIEIISHIFMLCLPPPSPDKTSGLPLMPLRLGSVCRFWRNVAWFTPRIWSVISLTIDKPYLTRALSELVTEWLSRSGQLPLHVSVSNHVNIDIGMDVMLETLIRAMTHHASRWKVLHLRGHFPPRFLAQFCYEGPARIILEGLSVVLFKYSSVRVDEYTKEYLSHLEKASPKRVTLSQPRCWDINELHWGNVTYLELTGFSSTQILSILHQSPYIEVLRLDSTDVGSPTTRLTLSSLHTLHVANDGWLNTVLDSISCPNLETFQAFPPTSPVQIAVFIDHSACSLTHLTISALSVSNFLDNFKLLFRLTPSLKVFRLVHGEFLPVGFFQIFGQPASLVVTEDSNANEDVILPCLREFILSICEGFEWSSVSLLLLGRPLSRISVDLSLSKQPEPVIGLDDLTNILHIIDLGVDIKITQGQRDIISSSRRFYKL